MSAWIVSKDTIDLLVSARTWARYGGITSVYLNGKRIDIVGNDSLGILLWEENLRSIKYRYPDDGNGSRPGPVDFRDEHVSDYTHRPVRRDLVSPVAVLKTISCFEYQSCEHPEWEASFAKAYCDALRQAMINLLSGYEEAPWGWERSDVEVSS